MPQLEKWVKLRECITGGKTLQTLKYVLQFTLKTVLQLQNESHLKECVTVKKWVTLKKCVTVAKIGHT